MAWDTDDITTNDIIVQDGVFAYGFTASGSISIGQAVCICGDNKVMVCSDGSVNATEANSIGLATMTASNGDEISIAGPGNICNACFDTDSDTTPGTAVYGDTYGILDVTSGNATRVAGYVVETPTQVSTNYVGKVLLC